MTDHKVFQIVYDAKTMANRDPDFEILDNLDNARPDWFEYWPIRNYLLHNELQDDTYYGFLSPSFGRKTKLSAKDVYAALATRTEDVVIFSSFLDQSAVFYNQIDHAENNHRGFADLFVNLFDYAALPYPFIQYSNTVIFSNFFLAKPAFWRRWLEMCEKIFTLAEAGKSYIGLKLCEATSYTGGATPAFKIFCIERIAAMLLNLEPKWSSAAPLAYDMPMALASFESRRDKLIFLDLIKYAARRDADQQRFIRLYRRARHDVLQGAIDVEGQ
jgi:hypothetical protein